MDIDDGGAGAVNEGVIIVTDGGGGSRDGGGLAPASWRLGGAVGSVPGGSGTAVLEAGNPIRRVSRLPDPGYEKTSMKRFFLVVLPPGLFLDCKRKGADHSRLYQSCQEPKVEVEEEVGLPSFPVPRLRIFQHSFMHFQNLQTLALHRLELVFSNFPPCHRLLLFLLTSRGEKQLIHKLES